MIEIEGSGASFKIQHLTNSNQGRNCPANIYIPSIDVVLLIGGEDADYQELNSVSMHLVGKDQWSMLPQTLNEARAHATACLTGDSLYIIGGLCENTVEKLPLDGLRDSSKQWQPIILPEDTFKWRGFPLVLSGGINSQ